MSTLVIDCGSSCIKAGYSGDDIPSTVMPSHVTTTKYPRSVESVEYVDSSNNNNSNSNSNNNSSNKSSGSNNNSSSNSHGHNNAYDKLLLSDPQPIQRGIVKDWEQLENLWQMVMNDMVVRNTESASILLIESSKATMIDRGKWAEMLFEKFHSPSVYFTNSASCTIFSSGRTSGLAVECGAGLTTTTPVFEGLALQHARVIVDFGGQDVSSNLKKLLNNGNVSLYDAKLIKERYARADMNFPNNSLHGKEVLYLPDGTEIIIDNKTFYECTNTIFNRTQNKLLTDSIFSAELPPTGITDQVFESWQLCDESLRSMLMQNVLVSGGGSLITGFTDRLHQELTEKVNSFFEARSSASLSASVTSFSSSYDLKVIPSTLYRERGFNTMQSKYASWIGGSILSSLDGYKELKITRQEWEESGDQIIAIKSM